MKDKTQEEHRKLLTAAGQGDLARLSALLSDYLSQADTHHVQDVVHAKTGEGLIHVAARGGHLSCLQHLLDAGCQVDQRSLEFKTALHEAAQSGQAEAVRLLLEAGAEVDSLKRADWTPLMLGATKAGRQDNIMGTKSSYLISLFPPESSKSWNYFLNTTIADNTRESLFIY